MRWFLRLVLSLSLTGFGIYCGYISYNEPLMRNTKDQHVVSLGAFLLAFVSIICFCVGTIFTVIAVEDEK